MYSKLFQYLVQFEFFRMFLFYIVFSVLFVFLSLKWIQTDILLPNLQTKFTKSPFQFVYIFYIVHFYYCFSGNVRRLVNVQFHSSHLAFTLFIYRNCSGILLLKYKRESLRNTNMATHYRDEINTFAHVQKRFLRD